MFLVWVALTLIVVWSTLIVKFVWRWWDHDVLLNWLAITLIVAWSTLIVKFVWWLV